MKQFILLSILFSININAGTFKVNSNIKDSFIYVVDIQSGSEKTIGKTPLSIPVSRLEQFLKKGRTIQIRVSKNGFKPFNLMVPVLKDTDLELYADLDVENDVKFSQEIDFLVTDLFDALRMIRLKDTGNAIQKLQELAKKFPHYSIIYEMMATSYYISKEYKKALNFYRKAFGMNPKNREAYKMKIYLEKKFRINKK